VWARGARIGFGDGRVGEVNVWEASSWLARWSCRTRLPRGED